MENTPRNKLLAALDDIIAQLQRKKYERTMRRWHKSVARKELASNLLRKAGAASKKASRKNQSYLRAKSWLKKAATRRRQTERNIRSTMRQKRLETRRRHHLTPVEEVSNDIANIMSKLERTTIS